MGTKQRQNRKLPSEIAWLQKESSGVYHLSFFDFFQSYSQTTAIRRFKEITKYISDEEKREQVLSKFNKWKRSKQTQQYWWAHRKNFQNNCSQNNEVNIDSSTKAINAASTSFANCSIVSTNDSFSVVESAEAMTLDEAKSLIRENCASNSCRNQSSLQKAFFDFKLDIFNSTNDSNLLSYESNLQQILALKKIVNTLTEDMDPILVKLLLCFKALVEALPSNTTPT